MLSSPLPRAFIAACVISTACVGLGGPSGSAATPSPFASSPLPSSEPAPAPSASASADAVVEVQAYDLGFSPSSVSVPATGTTRLALHNTGRVVHNLTIDALDLQVVASRGLSGEGILNDPPPGTYEFYCSVSGHKEAGMAGVLVVQDDAPAEPTGAPSPGTVSEGSTASG